MISANIHRYRVRLIIDRDPRCCWVVLPIRQDYDSSLLRLRHSRVATRGLQAREELAQDADGVLCARRQGSGDGWPACSRAERPRRIGRRGRDERVRDLQRWCVGRSKRYVSAFLCFSFPFLPNHSALHCISATRSENALEPKKATPRHRRGRRVSPIALDQGRAVSNICQLIYQQSTRKLEEKPKSEAVCATSRRNNLSIAPKHSTSLRIVAPTPGSPALRHRAPFHPLRAQGKLAPGWGVTSQLPARVLSSVARHWRDMSPTSFGGGSDAVRL
jgi:hypothetical protein